jgi:hypothetical protein
VLKFFVEILDSCVKSRFHKLFELRDVDISHQISLAGIAIIIRFIMKKWDGIFLAKSENVFFLN